MSPKIPISKKPILLSKNMETLRFLSFGDSLAAHRFFIQKTSRDEKAKAPLQAIKMAYSGAFWRPREGSNLRPRA